jgi:hypothetical protein
MLSDATSAARVANPWEAGPTGSPPKRSIRKRKARLPRNNTTATNAPNPKGGSRIP